MAVLRFLLYSFAIRAGFALPLESSHAANQEQGRASVVSIARDLQSSPLSNVYDVCSLQPCLFHNYTLDTLSG